MCGIRPPFQGLILIPADTQGVALGCGSLPLWGGRITIGCGIHISPSAKDAFYRSAEHRLGEQRRGFHIPPNTKGAVYRFTQVKATDPEDVFGSDSSTIKSSGSSIIIGGSSTISGDSSTTSESGEDLKRDAEGRLISEKFDLPFVESIEALEPGFLAYMESLATKASTKRRLEREELSAVIISLSEGHFITIKCLAHLLQRQEKTLRQDYLAKLCKAQRLRRAFPDTPNHEKQAYTKKSPQK